MARQYITTVKQKVVTMPQPVLRGLATVLKGKKGTNSRVSFKVDGIEQYANVSVERRDTQPGETHYLWTGVFTDPTKKKITLTCQQGDMMTVKRGRYRGLAAGAGDVIDVDITVTNPGSDPVTVEGFVEIG